jgi:hypothetical protein
MTYKKTIMAQPGFISVKGEIVGVCTAYQDPNTSWKNVLHRLISGECPEGAHIVTKRLVEGRTQIERQLHHKTDSSVLDSITWDFVEIELPIPAGWVKLEEKKFLYKWYGKYMPNLLFMNYIPEFEWFFTESWEYNLGRISDLRKIQGRYFKTAKGADAFEASNEGPHFLLADNWGGPFNQYRGQNSPDPKDCFYQRVASSNGGGSGTTYSIVPVTFKNQISIDDL